MIRLNQNENPFGPSPLAKQALLEEIDRLSVYPLPHGEPLSAALAERHRVEPERVVLSEGSGSISILIGLAEHATENGGKIVFSGQGYVNFLFGHMKQGGRLRMPFEIVPKKNDAHDLAALAERAQDPDARLVIVENPDNPTGTWIDREAFVGFMEAVPERVTVAMDGAYAEYASLAVGEAYPDPLALQERFPNLVSTRTFSKAYGLAGLRVGYAFAAPELAAPLNNRRAKLSVSAAAIVAAKAALQDEEHLQRTLSANAEQLQALEGALTRLGPSYVRSVANFVMFEPKTNPGAVCAALAKRGIAVSPLAPYGLPAKIRVSTGTAEQTTLFVEALEEALG